MLAVLARNGLKKALRGKPKMPASMTDKQWEDLNETTLSTIQLCLASHVLCEVLDKSTTASLWLALEGLYMTKSLANKIRLKECLYTFYIAEGTSIQNHFDNFNSILIDLECMDVKIEDEDKAILLVVILPSSYKHFEEILTYSNNETLSFKDVKASLLSKEQFDLELCPNDKVECLNVRGRPFRKEGTIRRNSHSKSRGHKSNKFCRYSKKQGYLVDECYSLKNKKEKERKNK